LNSSFAKGSVGANVSGFGLAANLQAPTILVTLTGLANSVRFVRKPQAGQRHAGEADAEFLQRRASRDRLGEALGEFIELVVHTFPFAFVFVA